jgi:hypothetical protein
MNLSKRLTGDFSATVRNQGRNCYWQSRVSILHASSAQVEALVSGSRSYAVSLNWEDRVLSAKCDCANFESEPCKHLWATILTADARGHLSAVPSRHVILDCGNERTSRFSKSKRPPVATPKPPKPPSPPAWKNQIIAITSRSMQAARLIDEWPDKREVLYIVDVPGSGSAGSVVLKLATRDRKPDGGCTRVAPLALTRNRIAQLPLPEDREILSAVAGGVQYSGWGYSHDNGQAPESYLVEHPLAGVIMPMAARTGRCYSRNGYEPDALIPLGWDESGLWEFGIEMRRGRKGWALAGVFRRGEERMDLASAALVTQGGLVFTPGLLAPLAEDADFQWISYLRSVEDIEAAEKDTDEFLGALLCSPGLPPLEVPEALHYEETTIQPRPGLRIRAADTYVHAARKLRAELSFDYEGQGIGRRINQGFYDAAACRVRQIPAVPPPGHRRTGLKFRTWTTRSYAGLGNGTHQAAAHCPRIGAGWLAHRRRR